MLKTNKVEQVVKKKQVNRPTLTGPILQSMQYQINTKESVFS